MLLHVQVQEEELPCRLSRRYDELAQLGGVWWLCMMVAYGGCVWWLCMVVV